MKITGKTLSDTDTHGSVDSTAPSRSEVRTAWQSMSDDNGGVRQIPGRLYWRWDDAKQAGDGWHGHPDPREQRVYIGDDGKTFLISDEIHVYGSLVELDRELALAKLTKRDREVLGV